MIATGGHKREEEYLKIWDANTGELVANLKGDTGTVYCLAWTADGKTLISGSEDHSIRTWNTTTWQQIAVLTGHTDEVYGIAISLNGRILASTSRDSTARLWNLETGQPIGSPLQHTGAVECPSFSRDGKQLATGCSDSNAYTWDISTIVEAAGLSELLNPNGKSLLDAGATPPNTLSKDGDRSFLDADARGRPNQHLEDADGLPLGFFDDSESPPHPHSSRGRRLLPFTAQLYHVAGDIPAHGRALLARVSSLSQRTYDHLHNTIPRPRRPEWPRNPFPGLSRSRDNEPIELRERRPAVVDVSCAHANFRHYSKGALLIKREKEKEQEREARKKAKDAKKASEGSPEHHQSSVPVQFGGAAQVQPILQPHAAGVSTSFTAPAIAATALATTSTTTRPDGIIIRDGRWTRFRIFICCMPAYFPDGRH